MTDIDFVIPFGSLPERFSESIKHPPETPATPRAAATIVLLRDAPGGMEVLLMRRNRNAGFVPGAYVFPGGRVDGTDAAPDLMRRLDGLSPESAAERLALKNGEPPAIAYYLAALREAFEETGILVGRRSDGSSPPTAAEDPMVDSIRDDVMEGKTSFTQAISLLQCRIEGHAIEYLAHWITPEPEPRRYDTRFFAVKVYPGAEPIVDAREMADAVWITPTGALERLDEGDLPMVFPTIKTLEQLAPYDTADAALTAIGRAPVRTIMPTLIITPTGVGLQLEDED
jgi:8-oxo-dGTP pyrophosphatase MutT (NUDIX family)